MTSTTKILRELAALADGLPARLPLCPTVYPKEAIAVAVQEFEQHGFDLADSESGLCLAIPAINEARALVGTFFNRLVELSTDDRRWR